MTKTIEGKLSDKPLAELIREIAELSASGALRLARDRAKAVIYFENGAVVLAASNIRAHRLLEFLKRTGVADETSIAGLSPKATDDQVLSHLVQNKIIRAQAVTSIRGNHVADILRGALLWTDGEWKFEPGVRVAGDTRVTLDARRLLLEATRHLPADYVTRRFPDRKEQIELAQLKSQPPNLRPAEAFVLSRIASVNTVNELLVLSGLSEQETLKAIYGLAICGAIKRGAWATSQFNGSSLPKAAATARARTDAEALVDFLARLERPSDHYDTLGVGRHATLDEIKNAYHELARHYHPDRFHQADAKLQREVESAFARVAQAYEILSDQSSRSDYDAVLFGSTGPPRAWPPKPSRATPRDKAVDERAETSFQKAVAAMKQNQTPQAVRFFAEAASIDPRCARYRAEYGRALINDPATRRLAEIELKAAIELDPNNASYRVALAELYKALGLRRRAESELQRALVADPKNAVARELLASLTS